MRQGGRRRLLAPLQMSNEIIRLCCHTVSLDRVFEGHVTSSKEDLQGCIACCQAWKDHYLRAVQMHTQYERSPSPPRPAVPLPFLLRAEALYKSLKIPCSQTWSQFPLRIQLS